MAATATPVHIPTNAESNSLWVPRILSIGLCVWGAPASLFHARAQYQIASGLARRVGPRVL